MTQAEVTTMTTTDSIREAGPYALASMAECAGPDGLDSLGAEWLKLVRDDAVEAYDARPRCCDDGHRGDIAHEIADGIVPIYTATRWAVFADLAAWQEDTSELGYDGSSDMTQLAGVALYMIAERLVYVVFHALDRENTDGGE